VSDVKTGVNRRVTGVHCFDVDGDMNFQKARAVIVAGYSNETTRLLLNSACPEFEMGLPIPAAFCAVTYGASR